MPGEPGSTPAAVIEANFAALGRFVQEFELMVNTIRGQLQPPFAGNELALKLAICIFNHNVMTARPLLEIYRTCMIIRLNDTLHADPTYGPQHEAALKILGELWREGNDLLEIRNRLLHGTWYIGFVSDADSVEEATRVMSHKGTHSKAGFEFRSDLVSSSADLDGFSSRCRKLSDAMRELTLRLDSGYPVSAMSFRSLAGK